MAACRAGDDDSAAIVGCLYRKLSGRGLERLPMVRWLLPHRGARSAAFRSEEHTSELQSLMRISYAVFCLKKKKQQIFYQKLTDNNGISHVQYRAKNHSHCIQN